MSGFWSDKMRHDCTRDGCLQLKLEDWSDVNDCFPGAIRPTDIDGMVEINGRVLFLEQKKPGVSIPAGQSRAFRELSKKQQVTVVAIRAGVETELQMLVYRLGDVRGDGWADVTRPDFLGFLRGWADRAMAAGSDTPWDEQIRQLQERITESDAKYHALELEYLALAKKKGQSA